ncbi:MAG TPA: sulfatase-like hydrolase/transferase, partial [Pirellulales bacterium]|nr:sulfatase-like hydrolase/transferase [Pirellulales bacterium]
MKIVSPLLLLLCSSAALAAEAPRKPNQPARPATLALAPIFRDHMVLQGDLPAPIWGTAPAGARITVAFAEQTKSTDADAQGQWLVKLEPLTTSREPRELSVSMTLPTATSALQIKDVLVGEVWLCSGQSNMAWTVGKTDKYPGVEQGEEEIAKPERAELRIFSDDAAAGWDARGWQRCGGDALRHFSATAFYFGDAVQRELRVPVGLVNVSRGGTSVQLWTRREFAMRNPVSRKYMELFEQHRAEIRELSKQSIRARRSGAPEPQAESEEMAIARRFPGPALYDSLIEPLAPFAVRGVVWYQGEANGSLLATAEPYASLLRDLIEGWRDRWSQPHMPWYVVQLPCYGGPKGADWPYVRHGQWEVAHTLPNVGLATICDVTDASNLHPPQKLETGQRIAKLALAKTYGKPLPGEGPTVASARREGDELVLKFADGGSPITLRGGAWNDVELAGTDGAYHPAKASFEGDRATVASEAVKVPTALRYGWRTVFTPSLYNEAGLPTAPFAIVVEADGKFRPGLAAAVPAAKASSAVESRLPPSTQQPAKRPNVLVIVADDLGWGDLGCYPKGQAWGEEATTPTPHLDALAAAGVRATQAYATCMVCSPSRAALLAGQYQQRFGFYGFAETTAPFPSQIKLLPEAMRDAGYSTGLIGKWHISFAPGSGPADRGFDRFFGFIGGQHDYFAPNLGQPAHGV